MARIAMCDRCERIGNEDAAGVLTFRTELHAAESRSKQLCPECIAELIAWIDDAEKVQKPAFREAYKPPEPATAIESGA